MFGNYPGIAVLQGGEDVNLLVFRHLSISTQKSGSRSRVLETTSLIRAEGPLPLITRWTDTLLTPSFLPISAAEVPLSCKSAFIFAGGLNLIGVI